MYIFPGMTIVQILMVRTRSIMRKAAVVLAATQIMLGGAPFAESGSRTTPHVEAAGVQLHHAHTEELCIACAALRVFDGAAPAQPASIAASLASAVAFAAFENVDQRLAKGPTRSRAPPSTFLA